MTRYFIAVPIGCLYVAVSSWLVHSQGVAYRNRLHPPQFAARPDPEPSGPRPPEPPAPRAGLAHAPPPAPPDIPRTPEPEPEPAPPASPEPASPAAPQPHPAAGGDAETRVTAAAAPSTPAAAAPQPARPPAGANPDTAWANSLDLSNLSPEDERRLGGALFQLILSMVPPVETGPWLQRTKKVAQGLDSAPYTITVLNSDGVYAFSHPGGFIYLSRGLFDLIGSDEDYALEFVLGHEMAHLSSRHALKCVAPGNAEAKKRGVDTVNQFLIPLALGYPDAMEFEADASAVKRMITTRDRSRREALAFLRKFQGFAESHEFSDGHKLPEGEAPLFENHYRGHVAAWERLDRLQGLTKTTPAPRPSRGSSPGPSR
jgi:hypothetical protein